MENLKIQHLIVLVALFVSLVGTLLLLDKINGAAEPLTGATTTIPIDDNDDQTEIQIIISEETNQTETEES